MDLLVVAIKARGVRFPYKPSCGDCANQLRQILDPGAFQPMLLVASMTSSFFSWRGFNHLLPTCYCIVVSERKVQMSKASAVTRVLGSCESLRNLPLPPEKSPCPPPRLLRAQFPWV